MSVVWRPPRKLLPVLALFLCLVSALVLVAQDENSAASAQSEMTEITASVLDDGDNTVQNEPEVVVEPDNDVTANVETPQEQEPVVDATADVETQPAASEASVEATVTETAPVVDAAVDAPAEPVAAQETPAVAPSVADTQAEPAAQVAPQSLPNLPSGKDIAALTVGETKTAPAGKVYFDTKRLNVLVIILALIVLVSYYTFHAQRGRELFIRRISGLSALEDAVGRATEMGRGVLYIPGIMDMDDIQTIAGVTILGHVAKKTAEYDTPLFAPMTRSFTMSVAQEIVKQSYLEKGRPDAFRPDRINYLTDDQFGFVAGVGGIMVREKPAACFYLGTFYAESLILAETGNAVGAIQIAGTAEPSQIPFFVAACDYTLIGEELFAASAYLSRNPKEVGSLKGQDMVKLIIIILIVVGTVLVTIAKTEFGSGTVFASLAENFMRLLN